MKNPPADQIPIGVGSVWLRVLLCGGPATGVVPVTEALRAAALEPHVEWIADVEALRARLTSGPVSELILVPDDLSLEVLHVVEECKSRLPVVVFSEAPNPRAAALCTEQGAADYIQLDRAWAVSGTIRRALRESRQRLRREQAEDRLRSHINLLQLQQVVANAAEEAASISDAVLSVLDITCAYGHFTLAHLFHVAEFDTLELKSGGIWSGYQEEKHGALRAETDHLANSSVVTLAKIVSQRGEVEWVPEIAREPRFVRAASALAAGLRSVVFMPVRVGGEVMAVIEFFTEKPRAQDEHLAQVLAYVATQLGRVFERDRAERRMEQRAREQSVLAELSRKAIEVTTLDEFFLYAGRRVEEVIASCRSLVLQPTADGSALRFQGKLNDYQHPWHGLLIPMTPNDSFGAAILQGEQRKFDFSREPRWELPEFLKPGIVGAIASPLHLRHGTFGAFITFCSSARPVSLGELAFLRGVANILAGAVEHDASLSQLQLLSSAITQGQEAIIITDPHLDAPGPKIQFVNPAFTKITGFSAEEALGVSPRFLQGPSTDPEFIQRVHSRLRNGKSAHGEVLNYRKDGREIWVEMEISPLRDPEGKITHFVGTQRDITERRIADTELRESEATLEAAQRLAHLGSWKVEYRPGNKTTLTWSEEVFRIFGYQPGGMEVTQKNFHRHIHPEDLEMVKNDFERCARARSEFNIDHRIILPDGSERTVHEQATFVYDSAGMPLKAMGTVQDVTERKQVEMELRHWKERYENLTRARHQTVYDWDFVGGHTAYGGDPEGVLGYTAQELNGGLDEWMALVHPEDRAGLERGIERALAEKVPFEYEYRFRHKEGHYITVKDSGYPTLGPSGQVIRIIGSVIDISTQRTLEMQVRRSQKMEAFGKLAGGVVHDFNNLLTIITGYNDVVMAQLDEHDPKREYIHQIARAADRAGALTRQLLVFSRQQKLQPTVFNLNTVLHETGKMLRRLIGEDVELRIQTAEDLGNVRADVSQIEQVIINLAVNARDVMPGGGVLTMTTANVRMAEATGQLPAGEYVLLQVTDSGMGMSPETLTQIFEPFFTTKAPGQGTGLGLATCYGICRQSGGEITVQSHLGSGSTFSVYLPRVKENVSQGQGLEHGGRLPTGHQTILVVEDERSVRTIISATLQRLHYKVLEAGTGDEALGLLAMRQGEPIQLVVTDVVMPRMSGRELADRVRAMAPMMPILYISGYPPSPSQELLPGSAYLQKPFTSRQLAEKVHQLLSQGSCPLS